MAQPDICNAQPDIWWGGLFDYSVKPGPDFVKVKARFGQVRDQLSHVKDQVGQGQGQELDNSMWGVNLG